MSLSLLFLLIKFDSNLSGIDSLFFSLVDSDEMENFELLSFELLLRILLYNSCDLSICEWTFVTFYFTPDAFVIDYFESRLFLVPKIYSLPMFTLIFTLKIAPGTFRPFCSWS